MGRNAAQLDSEFKAGLTDRLVAVIRSIEATEGWDIAPGQSDIHLYQLRAAHNLGFFQPFTTEQMALNAYLLHKRAGRRLCDYAWRLLAQSL